MTKIMKFYIASLIAASFTFSNPASLAQEIHLPNNNKSAPERDTSQNASQKRWTRTAENAGPPATTVSATPAEETANGTSWAPGGIGATNSILVKGTGLHVETAATSYNAGGSLANVCVDQYEISYYEGGQRKVETAGANCAVWRTQHTFQIYRYLDPYSPFCGRVQSGGTWGNYACITIEP